MLRKTLTAAFVLVALVTPSTAGAQTGEIEVRQDLRYTPRETVRLTLDAYLPPGDGPFPAVLVIPGGGWSRASKELPAIIDLSTTLAQNGFAAFGIDYRVSARAPYPAAVQDVQTAVSWVRENAAQFRVAPDRIAAIGHSAGGHLAATAATLGEGPLDQGSRVAAAVSMSGPMDLEALLAGQGEVLEAVQTFLDCPAIDEACAEVAREASPITHVDPTDAPMQLFNSTAEIIPADQATEMADALEDAGVSHDLLLIPGSRHGYFDINQPLTAEGTVEQSVLLFLTERLGGAGGVTPTPSPTSSPARAQPGGPAAEPILEREQATRLLVLVASLAALAVGGAMIGVRLARDRRERRELREFHAQAEAESWRPSPRTEGGNRAGRETRR